MTGTTDILQALELNDVYLPDMETNEEKLNALLDAFTSMQLQVKTEKDAAARVALETQKVMQCERQIEDRSQLIKEMATVLMSEDGQLSVEDAIILAATRAIKKENNTEVKI